MEFKINDIGQSPTLIKSPNSHKIEFQPISDADRLIDNADMVITGIAGKLKITMLYTKIRQSELNVILGKTWDIFKSNKTMVRQLTFPSPSGPMTINCYFAPMSIDLLPDGQHNSVDPFWSNFSLVLIEI